jgi:NAD(P)-dependent dehydrogenase (short-subunit alcohol dehydrogenase family)
MFVYFFFAVIGAVGFASVILPLLLQCFTHRPQNLRKRYSAEWAIVTGGSSGIGRSLCHKLASQGLSIVVVAVPDKLLDQVGQELREKYPKVSIRTVGADLSRSGYLEKVASATEDITVQLLFNNAGFMVTGFFADIPLEKWLANFECNVTASISLTHLFLSRLRARGVKRGAVAFTSSPANIIPSPFASMCKYRNSWLVHKINAALPVIATPAALSTQMAPPSQRSRIWRRPSPASSLLKAST